MIVAIGEIEIENLIEDFIQIAKGNNEINEKNSFFGKFRHEDGWGIAYYTDGWQLYKSVKPIYEDDAIKRLRNIKPKAVVIHARKATVGEKSIANTQPLYYEDSSGQNIFTHNGSIYDDIETIKTLIDGNSDSVNWFNKILNCSSEDVKNRYYCLNNYSSANFIHIRKDKIIIGQNYRKDPEYFTLKVYKDKSKTIVSSEVLPTLKDKKWHRLTNKSYVELKI